MGHLDNESFEEVYFGKRYENLRRVHKEKKFDELDYCKDCDFLLDEPESLVWTNDKDYKLGQMLSLIIHKKKVSQCCDVAYFI